MKNNKAVTGHSDFLTNLYKYSKKKWVNVSSVYKKQIPVQEDLNVLSKKEIISKCINDFSILLSPVFNFKKYSSVIEKFDTLHKALEDNNRKIDNFKKYYALSLIILNDTSLEYEMFLTANTTNTLINNIEDLTISELEEYCNKILNILSIQLAL